MRARIAIAIVTACGAVAGCGSSTPSDACGLCGPTVVAVGGDTVWAAEGRTLSRFDADSGDLRGRTEAARQNGPVVQSIALHGANAWLGWNKSVTGVSPSGRIVLRRTRSPAGYSIGMATVAGRTWMAAGRWAIALADDGSIRLRHRLPGAVAALTEGDRMVWAVGGSGYAAAFDAHTGRRSRMLTAPAGSSDIAVWRRRVWIASPQGLDQFDATTGRRLRHAGSEPAIIATGEEHLWALTYDGVLTRMDPETGVRAGPPLELGDEVGSAPPTIATGAGAVWVGLRAPGVVRIDATTMRVVWRRSIPPT